MTDLKTLMLQGASGSSGGNPNAWDISKAYYDAGADAGDVSKAAYSGLNFSINSQENNSQGLAISADGSKAYIVGAQNDTVYQYTLPIPWSLDGASYASKSFSVASESTYPTSISFKPDGTKMYILSDGGTLNDAVGQYTLSTPWDVSTASYDSVSFSVAAKETNSWGMFFSTDGTNMYICGPQSDSIHQYTLGTAWDISTASFLQSKSISAQESDIHGLSFTSDGLKMYMTGDNGDDINQYDLSTAWDISTASYVQNFSVSAQTTYPVDVVIKPDGTSFLMLARTNSGGTITGSIYQYVIGGFSVAAQETSPNDLFFKPDGTKMYIVGAVGDDVNEYSLSTAWDITTASYVQNFSVAAQETSPVGLFFKDDGTKMYVLGSAGDDVNEYSLSSAWDISTASYVQNFSVTTQDTAPLALSFKSDGTKMYVVGNVNDTVFQYSLSTAWDVSSASYDSVSFSVLAQSPVPRGLFFKPDGTKMYVTDSNNTASYEYDLSTPWDVSSASYVQNLVFGIAGPFSIFWKDDGNQFFMLSATVDQVFSYLILEE